MMRKLLVIILMGIGSSIFGQVVVEGDIVDEFTGKRKVWTNPIYLASRRSVVGRVSRVNDSFRLQCVVMSNLGCVGARGNYIIFLFEDGSNVKYDDIAKIDCKDIGECQFILIPEDFEGKKVVKFRIKLSEEYKDFIWDESMNMIDILKLIGYDTMVEVVEPIIDSTQVEVISN